MKPKSLLIALGLMVAGGSIALAADVVKDNFIWRGVAAKPVLTKVLNLPGSNPENCTIYRLDTEGRRLYIAAARSNYDLNCQVVDASRAPNPPPED